MGGGEDGEERKRRLHALRERLVAGTSEERVQPDEPPGTHADGLQRTGEHGRIAGVPAVAQDDDDRAAVDEPTPVRLEGGESFADARATTDLTTVFSFTKGARKFRTIPAPQGFADFINDTRPQTPPDDD